MEDQRNANIPIVDRPLMTSPNEKDQDRSLDDIMMRRLKNRERQRRYRARKRLEADIKSAQTSLLSPHHEADIREVHMSSALPHEITQLVPQIKKASPKDQSKLPQFQMPMGGTQDVVTRVHCQRDWKKDARRPQAVKEQEARLNFHAILEPTAVSGSRQRPPLPPTTRVDPPLDTGGQSSAHYMDSQEPRITVPSRRHWKAEARSKKS